MRENFEMDLRLFDAGANVNTTEGYADNTTGSVTPYTEFEGLSDEMKTYYSAYLIDNAEPKLIHDQFAQKMPIPAHGGKTIQFRKYDPLPKLNESLVEGVTPTGQSLNMSMVEATVRQYGGYVELSDLLILSAVDNNLVMVTKLLGAQAGRTLDAITREVLCGGTNVQYAAGEVSARHLLVGGKEKGNHYLSVDAIKRAVRFLKNQNAEKINGAYACIIHPDCAYDLMNDLNWKYPYQYANTTQLYEGEIGMLEGVRFVESPEAKVFYASEFAPGVPRLFLPREGYMSASSMPMDYGESTPHVLKISESPETYTVGPEIVGKMLQLTQSSYGVSACFKVAGCCVCDGESYVCFQEDLRNGFDPGSAPWGVEPKDTASIADAGADGRAVYATLVLGENAYGTTEITGGGLEYIVKQLGSAGTADPLNQRATVGWKATKAAVRLMEPFMIRIETASTFEGGAN